MNPTSESRLPPRVASAIKAYIGRGRSITSRPVSIDRIVRTTRYAMPHLKMSDDELARMIALELVDAGCNIDFDRGGPEPEIAIRR